MDLRRIPPPSDHPGAGPATHLPAPRHPDGAVGASGPGAREDRPLAKLSIVMAVYNEERTVAAAVRDVLDARLPCPYELIVVDDGSTDATAREFAKIDDPRVLVHRHPVNLGKGSAVRTGMALASGDYILPFDADLEYSAKDIPKLLAPVLEAGSPVVYGVRHGQKTTYPSIVYVYGNRALTGLTNALYHSRLTDLHTCLKLVRADLVHELPLRENGFGADTELTAALLQRGIRPVEVPVSYQGRTHREGKKISWRDGVECVMVLSRVWVQKIALRPTPRVVVDLTPDDGT